jgi:hypothetical protein
MSLGTSRRRPRRSRLRATASPPAAD